MVLTSTSYSRPIIFWVSQTFSSAYTASTPPWPLAAIKVRYSAADERTMDTSFFLATCGGLLLLIPIPRLHRAKATVTAAVLSQSIDQIPWRSHWAPGYPSGNPANGDLQSTAL